MHRYGDVSMMDWITNIFEHIGELIPRLFIVDPDELGVKVCLGKIKTVYKPSSWSIYIPLVSDVYTVECKTIPLDLPEQSIWVENLDIAIAVSATLELRIVDIVKNLFNVSEPLVVISNRVMGLITEYYRDEERKDETIYDYVNRQVYDEFLDEYGVEFNRLLIHDYAKHKVIRIMGNGGKVVIDEEE